MWFQTFLKIALYHFVQFFSYQAKTLHRNGLTFGFDFEFELFKI